MKKKVATIAVAGVLAFGILGGGASTFADLTLVGGVKSFIQTLLGNKSTELNDSTTTKKTSEVSEISTFLTGLKNRITTDLGGHNEAEKTRAQNEIDAYNKQLQEEADATATTDTEAGKAQLTSEANEQISNAKTALDSKYAEIFPGTTP